MTLGSLEVDGGFIPRLEREIEYAAQPYSFGFASLNICL